MTNFCKQFDFKNPDYEPVWAERMARLERLRADPSLVPTLIDFYRENPSTFISDWGVTYEPRNPERGLPANTPFLLFPKQEEWITWVLWLWRNQKPGICEKSRDVGASWLAMALSCTLCLFNPGLTIGVGSRKEELIDRSGDPSSLFHKARMFMEHLPVEFRGDWDSNRDSAHMRLVFPATGSAIVGEAGDQIGRGGRSSIFFVDEAAFLERPQLIDASLSATTNCRIDLSSVNGMANSFATKRHSGKFSVFTFSWRDDPRKDQEWYEKKCAELDPVVVASEIDLAYNASVDGVLIPALWIQAAIDAHRDLGIEPSGMEYGALDVADEGVDLNAFCYRHGIVVRDMQQWSGKGGDIYQTVVRAFDLCDAYKLESFWYDADGMGAGVRGDSKVLNEQRQMSTRSAIQTKPFRGSAAPIDPESEMVPQRKNKDFFANFKAMSWWALRLRFQATYRARQGLPYCIDEIISLPKELPHLNQLVMELSQPTYYLNSVGKVLIDKAPAGTKSPNLADAVMIAFNPEQRGLEAWMRLGNDLTMGREHRQRNMTETPFQATTSLSALGNL